MSVNDPDKIIIHCTDSPDHINTSVETIKNLHVSPKTKVIDWYGQKVNGRGFSDIAYHYIITRDGKLHKGRPDNIIGAHTSGQNKDSIAICLVGRKDFEYGQISELIHLYQSLHKRYGIVPSDVYGHYEFNKHKTCPNIKMDDIRLIFTASIISTS